ncbi:hypothetical protein D8B26_002821 [Coccidioides posadasii str. Silveira]|uniref:Uncharacterized protein n=3 Tax=Coccidioides posadasii TaxID=199306 RepID=E9CY57_COCPS|nr:hypothetical protein CPC735_009360 [Coccidioides posadasii C735 delta SOWgp]EER26760.1 hypothetical protein CPC735_009360 [Coccidioides posadasii C735 delta SOWgp]EFW20884.1 conserved hypothetical protein [Coccidioides posadasii str. Silveira]KMM72560.1 hypothetical protein CPAG_08855 [Coccidioides posadasii RMSCC 3488]QVM08125.1 hypothetical protein D8B26_002821 [Coccidioides posadasii str. Silveira]|eukprot:XP_003068905.1 hypothetical protein CPC735_009360 [Coccidioides posadasii C735 delta SOWgp]
MDAKAYLMSQGWSGPGNPLQSSRRPGGPHAGLGLTKPILVARKKNTHGIGKKTTHDHTNQWWLRGFEEALKGVGDDGSATPTTSASEENRSGMRSELYRFFVRGEGLKGTIGTRVDGGRIINSTSDHGIKRKRDEVGGLENVEDEDVKKKKRKRKETLADDECANIKNINKAKRNKKSKSKDKSQDVSNPADEVESSGSKSKKKKREKSRKEDQSAEASPTSGTTDAEDSVSNGQLSEKDAGKKRKELKKPKKESKRQSEDDRESKSRKKRRKMEADDK